MWFKYLLIALTLIEAIGYIGLIGEERKPVTKSMAASQVIFAVTVIFGLLYFWK